MTEIFGFKVQGSEIDPYLVIFKISGANVTATCTCPAGISGTYCKHRVNLMLEPKESKFFNDFNDSDKEKITSLQKSIPGTNVWEALLQFQSAREAVEDAKLAEKAARKKFERQMRG